MWDSAVLEKRKTIIYCLIIENLPQKNTASVSMGPYVMGISLFIEFVFLTGIIIFFGLFIIYFCGFFICYYVFKTYVSVYIYYNMWDLKSPCQTRKSVRTDFIYGITLVTCSWKSGCLKPTFNDQPISLSRGFADSFAPSLRTYLTYG